jgi:hypothetical protein
MMGHHDPGDEAVGHANAHAVPFQGSTDLGRRIGSRLVEWKTRQGGEELADELQLARSLRPGEQLEAWADRKRPRR